MPNSILEAIRLGVWNYEPDEKIHHEATPAMPGTHDKLRVLAERIENGLPLWHPRDRRDYDEKFEP